MLKDLKGQKFGKVTVLKRSLKKVASGNVYWECQCECGNISEIKGSHLLSGSVKSCGCMRGIRHGHAVNEKLSPTYITWVSMVQRCINPTSGSYSRYGAKGITVCSQWQKFENFLADMGERPPNQYIERIDNSKGYEPGNCKWATRREQSQNQFTNDNITFQGETLCLTEWARKLDIPQTTLWNRLYRLKWSIERAFRRG
jgi:hypothetical protein